MDFFAQQVRIRCSNRQVALFVLTVIAIVLTIDAVAIVGRKVICFGSSRSSRRDGGGGQVWMIGLALIVVGYIGYFFARLIQAAVVRSRESLADASAV